MAMSKNGKKIDDGLIAAGKSAGRPDAVINWTLVKRLAHIQCTVAEVAQVLGVHIDTLYCREGFSEQFKTWSEAGRASLRRRQYRAAMNGNAALLIWLGKQYLGQREDITLNHTGKSLEEIFRETTSQSLPTNQGTASQSQGRSEDAAHH